MAILNAGIKFYINDVVIPRLTSVPAFIAATNKISTTSFDNLRMETQKEGLIPATDYTFEFISNKGEENVTTVNEELARAQEGKVNKYKVEFPDGSAESWSGTHRTGKIASTPGDVLKFQIACTAETELEHTAAT